MQLSSPLRISLVLVILFKFFEGFRFLIVVKCWSWFPMLLPAMIILSWDHTPEFDQSATIIIISFVRSHVGAECRLHWSVVTLVSWPGSPLSRVNIANILSDRHQPAPSEMRVKYYWITLVQHNADIAGALWQQSTFPLIDHTTQCWLQTTNISLYLQQARHMFSLVSWHAVFIYKS